MTDNHSERYEKTGILPLEHNIDNYLKNVEGACEQNYNQIDGIINNEGPRRADLTDGQTFEEIQELAPETLHTNDKPSILEQLKEAQAQVGPPDAAKEKRAHGLDRD